MPQDHPGSADQPRASLGALCPDLPPCRQCGGRLRWRGTDLVPSAPWCMHCLRCSPPPLNGRAA